MKAVIWPAVVTLTLAAGCESDPSHKWANPNSGPTTKKAEAKKDVPLYEIESGGKVYVFGKIDSANAFVTDGPPANGIVKENFNARGQTVVFEDLGGDQTEALIAAYAKNNKPKAK